MVIGARSRGSLAVGLGLLLSLAAAPVAADYQESFRKGMQAYDRKNWSEVLEWMGRAARERNTEGGSKVNLYGMRFEHYLPHFYMGVAHFESGDPASAEAEWQISQSQGAIQKSPQNRELQKYLRQLEDAKAGQRRQLDAALTAAQTEIDRAAAAAAELDRLRQDTAGSQVFQRDASLETGRTSAAELLASARGALKKGRDDGDPASVARAKDQATQARTQFERIGQSVNQEAQELRAESARQAAAEASKRDAAALDQAVQAARKEIDQAAAAESALNRLRQDQIGGQVFRQNPALEQARRQASSDLQAARDLLSRSRSQSVQKDAVAAADGARQAGRQFEALRQQVGGSISDLKADTARRQQEEQDRLRTQQRRAVENELDALRRDASGLVAKVKSRSSPSAALVRSKATLERLIARGTPAANAPIEDLNSLKELFSSSIAVAQELLSEPESAPAGARPPAELIASARAYFSGQYRQALTILQGAEFSEQRSAIQAHLFRAAAQYALFHSSGGGDPQLLDQARQHVQACRRLDAAFVPDSQAFTPRFIAFFQQGP